MAFLSFITAACVFACLGLLDSAHGIASVGRSCCTSYTRSPVPFHRITGFKIQTVQENCDMDAIIFYTVKKNQICATKRDEWVRRTLDLLSAQLKKMAKAKPDGGNHLKKKKSDPMTTSFSSTETSQNLTEVFSRFA